MFLSYILWHFECNVSPKYIINVYIHHYLSGTAYPSGANEFTPDFQWGSFYSIFSYVLQIVVCPSNFWPLCCLSFDLRILITPLVSSNCSYLNNIPKTAILTFVLFLKQSLYISTTSSSLLIGNFKDRQSTRTPEIYITS